MSLWERIISTIWRSDLVHRVQRRQRILEDHRDLLAADRHHLLRREPDELLAVDRWPNLRSWPTSAADPSSRGTSPTCPNPTRRRCPTISPGPTSRSMPRTAWTLPVHRVERDPEVAQRQHRVGHQPSSAISSFGSVASRRPSPMKLMQTATSTNRPHGNTTSHQWPACTALFESPTRLPSDVLPDPAFGTEPEEGQCRLGDHRADHGRGERDEDRSDGSSGSDA